MAQTVTVITGGSMGIGLAIAKQQADSGAIVVNLDVEDFTQSVDGATWIECDVSKVDKVTAAIAQSIGQFGHIDRLVCNAGKHISANIEDTSEEVLDALIALNIKGAYAAIRATLPNMRERQRGAIVLMGSDQTTIGKRTSFAYGLTKAALGSMAKSIALDYAPFNIRVNAVCPGTIETPLFHYAIDNYLGKTGANKPLVMEHEASAQPLGRIGQPEDVAALTGFLLSEEAGFITGSLHAVDGGFTAQ